MTAKRSHPAASDPPRSEYARAQVRRALERERIRKTRRLSLEEAAREAARALHRRFGESIEIWLFGSVLDEGRFRLDSDIDLAVRGLPPDRFYEAWAVAEAAAGIGPLDLVRLEDAPPWLSEEVVGRGERVP